MARSTGARAFPPAPQRTEREALPPARVANVAPAAPSPPATKAANNHPQRGIARSTGARAFPPAAQRTEREALPPARVPDVAPAAPTPPAETPAASVRSQRGLAKESPRLSKLVSAQALCSRREADEWIENGWVSVDGVIITTLGARVNPKARIQIKEAASTHQTESVTILFNRKPCDDPDTPRENGRENAAELIRAENRWPEDDCPLRFKIGHLRGLALAGRLEPEEGGMLVFTQEGSVARRLTGGDARLEREYHVRVEGHLLPGGLELLRHGLSLDKVKLLRAQVSWLSDRQLRFVLHENRKRQIQSMCELVGVRATDIKRVRIGSVSLGKLAPGQWRYLRAEERF
jgi:23S rRNA pseudouridine2604 synthase